MVTEVVEEAKQPGKAGEELEATMEVEDDHGNADAAADDADALGVGEAGTAGADTNNADQAQDNDENNKAAEENDSETDANPPAKRTKVTTESTKPSEPTTAPPGAAAAAAAAATTSTTKPRRKYKKRRPISKPNAFMHKDFDSRFILPPPPPPPPPIDNPYYRAFANNYWNTLHSKRQELFKESNISPDSKYYFSAAQQAMGLFNPMEGVPIGMPPFPFGPHFPMADMKPQGANEGLRRCREEYPINTDRPTYFLGAPEDEEHLNEKMCYARSRCFEVILATEAEMIPPTTTATLKRRSQARKPSLNQVGIRCVYCAGYKPNQRPPQSCTFPRSISRIHDLINRKLSEHTEFCPAVPKKVLKTLKELNKGIMDSPRHYVEKCCREQGMVDAEELDEDEEDGGEEEQEEKAGKKKKWGVLLKKEGHGLISRKELPEFAERLFLPL